MSSAPPQQGTLTVPYRFITIFIIAHGEDIKERHIGSFNATTQEGKYETFKSLFRIKTTQLNAKHYKLTVSGLTGNITNGSPTVDAIYSQVPRILAHDRTMSPLQKLNVVHEKMHSEFNFKSEVEYQTNGQRDHVSDHLYTHKLYQRTAPLDENWFPKPTLITCDKEYSFNANPIDAKDRTSTVMERNEFGVWLLDASLDIATMVGLRPGCETETDPLSLLNMLEISLSTSRTHASSDQTGATTTTLFIIMTQLMQEFGDDIHINVVDVGCRYHNWNKKPGVEKRHTFGRGLQRVGALLPYLGRPLTMAGKYLADEVLSADARLDADTYEPEHVRLDDVVGVFPVEKWYYDGNIKLRGLDNVWKLEGLTVTSTRTTAANYNLIRVGFGHDVQTIDTTTLFSDVNIDDIIVNGHSIETTHDIEVFHVIRTPTVKIMITLKRKPAMKSIASWLPGDHDTDTNAYLTLVGLDPKIREWTIDRQSALFFEQVYRTVVRREAVIRRRKKRSRSNERRTSTGGRKKQKKRRTRRLRVKTNKSKKTRFRYSASYRK